MTTVQSFEKIIFGNGFTKVNPNEMKPRDTTSYMEILTPSGQTIKLQCSDWKTTVTIGEKWIMYNSGAWNEKDTNDK